MADQKTDQKYVYAIGRRKASIARVRLFEGKGENMIVMKNDEAVPVTKYFPMLERSRTINRPFEVTDTLGKYYFTAKMVGGGKAGQLGALVHALARALTKISPEYKGALKAEGFIRRDPRMVERKKVYRKKARKRPQFSKR